MDILEPFTTADGWISLATLTAMEVVLGIDNVVFLSITTSKLPEKEQPFARFLGLALALIMRLGLLFAISWVMSLTTTLFTVAGWDVSGRSLIMLFGGLFLIAKATHEMFSRLEVPLAARAEKPRRASFALIIAQIVLLDIVFSLDSVITAVGMARHISIMTVAMVIAVGVMLTFAGRIGAFVHRHPSMKVLALSFLLLIGVVLMAEGLGQHIAKGYIYFAMAFSLAVELINMRLHARRKPVELHDGFREA